MKPCLPDISPSNSVRCSALFMNTFQHPAEGRYATRRVCPSGLVFSRLFIHVRQAKGATVASRC
jgi:hypothetical protein